MGEIKYTNVHIIGRCFACRSLLMEITVSRCYLVQLPSLGDVLVLGLINMKFALNFIWIENFSLKVKYLISLMVQSFIYIFFKIPPLHVYFHLSPQHLCKTLLCIYELAVQLLFYFHHRMYSYSQNKLNVFRFLIFPQYVVVPLEGHTTLM